MMSMQDAPIFSTIFKSPLHVAYSKKAYVSRRIRELNDCFCGVQELTNIKVDLIREILDFNKF